MAGVRVAGVAVRKGGETITLRFVDEAGPVDVDLQTGEADVLIAAITQGAGAAAKLAGLAKDHETVAHMRWVSRSACHALQNGEVLLQLVIGNSFPMNFRLTSEQAATVSQELLKPPGVAAWPRHN